MAGNESKIILQVPVAGMIIQDFGGSPDIYARFGLRGHNGVDYECPVGTPVFAAAHGTVTKIQTDADGYGLHVRLTHPWGRTIYAHLSEVTCKLNQVVHAGALIGRSGNSGFSSCPHLHFEVRQNGLEGNGYNGALDPLPLFQTKETASTDTSHTETSAPAQENQIFSDPVLGQCDLKRVGVFEVVYSLGLNVRADPSTDGTILFGLVNGQRVKAVAEAVDESGNRWAAFTVWFAVRHDGQDLAREA